jgi:HSP20 family molecular chaperone IbpA
MSGSNFMRTPRGESACLFWPAAGAFLEVTWRPAADIYRTPGGWLAKFDLAGVRPEEVRVEVHGRCLSVQGVRRDWVIEEGCHYHSLEIVYSPFERRLEFPVSLEQASIRTEHQFGMFLVRVLLGEERP